MNGEWAKGFDLKTLKCIHAFKADGKFRVVKVLIDQDLRDSGALVVPTKVVSLNDSRQVSRKTLRTRHSS